MTSTFLPRYARARCIRLFLACSLAPLPALLPGTTQALETPGTLVQWGMPIVTSPQVSDVTRVSIGELHVLALKQDGELLGWGSNANGELQVQAGTFGTHLTQIAAGNNRSAGLWSDGRVTGSGFLGGFTYSSWTEVTAISMNGVQTIGRRSDGTVLATGGTAPPAGLTDVAAVAAGGEHALALLADGSVVAWGNNNYGQCNVPAGLTAVTAIAAGTYHSLALLADGSVVAWGAGAQNSGQWPDHGQSMVPQGLQGVTAIAAGALHSVALKSDGSIVCWGNNDSGQCDVPPGLSTAFRIAAGAYATAAIIQPAPEITVGTGNLTLLDGSRVTIGPVVPGGSMVRTFTIFNQGTAPLTGIQVVVDGVDGARFILTPPAVNSLAPMAFTSFSVNFQPVAAGAFFARVRILSNDSDEGEFDIPLLGTTPMGAVTWGGRRDRLLDRIPEPIADAIGVATSAFCSAVLRADGRVLLWGGDWENGTWVTYLSNGSPATPVTGIRQIDLAAESYGVLLTNDGVVLEFDTRGWLESSPALPPGSGVTRVAAGYQHFLAQLANGSLFAWGDNTYGQTEVPVGQTGLLVFSAGGYHSAAVTAQGTVIAWGRNANGQCDVPPGLVGAVAVAAGGGHTLALKNDGTVVAWGANDSGQCNVPPGLSGVVAVSARGSSSAAIRADGSLVLWGAHQGQAPPGLPRVADYRCDAIALVAPVGELRIEHLGTELRDGMGFDFGWTPPGMPLAKTFTIRNRGGASAPLTLVKSGAEAARYTVSGMPASLAPGASANFTVTLLPTAVGPQHAVLSIFGNDPFRNPLAFALAGRTPMSVSAWGLGVLPHRLRTLWTRLPWRPGKVMPWPCGRMALWPHGGTANTEKPLCLRACKT
jgi:alpha-tubulin suppressor-like RCC1 family protein